MDSNKEIPDAATILADTKRLRDLVRHIRNVQDAAIRIGEKCIENGDAEFGRSLVANAFVHDQSKFRGIEWDAIGSSDAEKKELIPIAIRNHQTTNSHHPEYWTGGIDRMPEIYIAEMVCDTYARSVEMGTSLRDWWKDVGLEKYNIPKSGKVWKIIKKYIDMILSEQF